MLMWLGQSGPTPSSAAIADSAELHGELVRSLAVTAANNGIDHLLAWAGLRLRGRLGPSFAHYTLLRSALEGVCRSRWLADAKVDRRVRIARAIGAQLADLTERRKIEQLPRPADAPPLPPRGPNYRTAAVRIANLEESAAAAGLCPLRITTTDLLERFGPGEASYRIQSAFAHGWQSVTFAASQVTVNEEPDLDGLLGSRIEANVDATVQMTEVTVHTAAVALRELFTYHGRSANDAPG